MTQKKVSPVSEIDELKKNVTSLLDTVVRFKEEKLSGLIGQLEALGPLATLKRGYSASFKLPEEELITSFDLVKPGDRVKTKLKKGFFTSQVEETHA